MQLLEVSAEAGPARWGRREATAAVGCAAGARHPSPVLATPPRRLATRTACAGRLAFPSPREGPRPGRARGPPSPHCGPSVGSSVGLSPPRAPSGGKQEEGLAREPAGFQEAPGSLAGPLTAARRLRPCQTRVQPGSRPVARGLCPGEGGGVPPLRVSCHQANYAG